MRGLLMAFLSLDFHGGSAGGFGARAVRLTKTAMAKTTAKTV